ncbi:MAG: hypothetical protein ACK5M7_07155 [Draconibacterium sp.]
MSKKACKKKDFEDKKDPHFECKKCGAKVKKEDKVCKPKRID